ncbi:MAG: GNAT family N-acetyltransferase [Gammaproteobacteria bacterium]|nr:GNAT family N-acetyltransferase [Gammaproteobacteria bacterium]
MPTIIETERLILRTWCDDDLEPMFRINQDPKVMEYFSALGSKEETQNHINRICKHQDEHGYSLYVVELKSTHKMIGFIGLLHRIKAEFNVPFNPSIAIGWRLSLKHWGKGFATEGASAVLDYAFCVLGLPEIVSFTVTENKKSRRVMEKIGLTYNPDDDFDHPKAPDDSPLKQHVLYRITKKQYLQSKKGS